MRIGKELSLRGGGGRLTTNILKEQAISVYKKN
jgi:hypothetical protein